MGRFGLTALPHAERLGSVLWRRRRSAWLVRAGFEVTGVDHVAKHAKSYPGRFIHGDALRPPVCLADYDLIWASPPCQRYSQGNNLNPGVRQRLPDLIAKTRGLIYLG